MDKAIFTEDMTVDEFIAKVRELDTPKKRQEAATSLVNVLGLTTSGSLLSPEGKPAVNSRSHARIGIAFSQ